MIRSYVGEIRMFAGDYAPEGWMPCDGALLPVVGNEALFALLGTAYGGDGVDTFALPDLRGRLPVHPGNGVAHGTAGGAEEVALTATQLPAHSHALRGSSALAVGGAPAGRVPAQESHVAGADPYLEDEPSVALAAAAVGTSGGGAAHSNLQPYLCVGFIISLFGSDPTVL